MSSYKTADPLPESVREELTHFDPLLGQLLFLRGIRSREAAERFLEPSYDEHLHDPFLLHDMEKAATRLLRAVAEGERIAIYSDYDCDGIPGAVILHDFLKHIGHENFTNYIPHRHYDGFGVSVEAVEKLHKDGATLIVTIDCGTCDVEAIHTAKQLGIDVIVTDHHLPAQAGEPPKTVLPEAIAVVNPKVGGSYPFDGLCGAGVIFKLVQAVLQKGKELGQFDVKEGWEKWWLDMVGIATIADMVPLIDENRVFARYGLEVLRKSRRPGLQQLLRRQRASQQHLSEDDIGFTIGPRINAASRMDDPEDAFYMLAATDEAKAGTHVEHLEKLNNERKGMVAAMTKDIHKRLRALEEVPPVIVMGNPEWRPSLVGLAANKLAEEYKRPAFLWGRDGNGIIKGSTRSDGRTSVVTLMDAAKKHFIEFGGHHFSGGFSVIEEQIHTLPRALCMAFDALGEAAYVDEPVIIDASLTLDELNDDVLKTLQQLAPFGAGNHKPLFEFKGVTPSSVDVFGKGKEHLKLSFETQGIAREAIAFFKMPTDFPREPKAGEPLTLLAHLEQSFFMNRLQTRLRIVDIV